jgi:hypothetical protein
MTGSSSNSPRERMQAVLYESSYKRLRGRGLSEAGAARIAGEVAERSAQRTMAPDFSSQADLAAAVSAVCRDLGDGKSYYDLIEQRPYLVTGRIDRLVSAAGRVNPQVPIEVAMAARKATTLERLSGGLAVLFSAAALAVLGVWYAVAVGVVVAGCSEVYVQTGMPPAVRRFIAHYRLSQLLGLIGLALLAWSGYSWLEDSSLLVVKGIGLALFAVLVIAVIPGLTLVTLVSLRERRWREALEKELVAKVSDDIEPEETSDR